MGVALILVFPSVGQAGLITKALTQAKLVTKAPPHRMSKESGTIEVAGLQRTYLLYVPSAYDGSQLVPLVIVLHGGGGSGRNVEAFTVGQFNDLAEMDGFLVAYPDAVKYPAAKRNWNDGRNVWRYPAQRNNVDDVGFLSALIDHLIAAHHVDPQRVYATGPSNGGHMSLRLGCELSEKLAAIAPVIGELPEPLAKSCAPVRRLPVLMINSVTDPMVPWQGGWIHFGMERMGRGISVPETVRFWADRNGCASTPEAVQLPDVDPQDGTRVRREVYRGCKEGADVILYAVEGGGHTWPGAYQYATEKVVGRTSFDINASQLIWGFFKSHQLHKN